MDPVLIKFAQLIFAEIVGAALCLFGMYLFVRGISGKSNMLISGAGLKAKLTNGAPGSIIAILGVVVIALSLNSSVERKEITSGENGVLDQWIQRADQVTDNLNYGQTTDLVVGKSENNRFVVSNIVVVKDISLSDLSSKEYNEKKFWKLLAVANKDRNYFTLKNVEPGTVIRKGSLMEVWRPSTYNGMQVETRTRVAGVNKLAAYDDMLQRAQSGAKFNFSNLSDEFKSKELELAYSEIDNSGLETIRDISLKYYGNPKYWPIVVWTNPDILPASTKAGDPIPDKPLHVAHFIGWPR